MKTKTTAAILSLLLLLGTFSLLLTACDEKGPVVDYSDITKNSYTVTETQTDDYKLYIPDVGGVRYGFIFYLGTAMNTDNYDHILRRIAAAGIAVYVSANFFADLAYSETEQAYDILDVDSFFIGGHSQGGGAAVRRAVENLSTTSGVVLFSPLISNDKTLKDTSLPSIYFEAENDYVLNATMQAAAKERMNDECRFVVLQGAGHMCYGTSSLMDGGGTTRDKTEIQDEVARDTLEFMNAVINATD